MHRVAILVIRASDALLSLGHVAAQGESELAGTAIETSYTITLRITVRPAAKLPMSLQNVHWPLGETRTVSHFSFASLPCRQSLLNSTPLRGWLFVVQEYMIHGFAYSNYLAQLAVPSTIGVVGADLNLAFNGAFNHTRDFLMDAFVLLEDEAIGLMSVGCDFIITQVGREFYSLHSLYSSCSSYTNIFYCGSHRSWTTTGGCMVSSPNRFSPSAQSAVS